MSGSLDANGVWIYDESDFAAPASDMLNLGQESVSDALEALGLIVAKTNGRTVATLTADTTGVADTTERIIAQGLQSLSVTFAAVAGATYCLTVHGRFLSSTAGDRLAVKIRRGAAIVGSTVIQDGMVMPGFAAVGDSRSIVGFDSPGAGPVTYLATFTRAGGGGTARVVASATGPAFLEARRVA